MYYKACANEVSLLQAVRIWAVPTVTVELSTCSEEVRFTMFCALGGVSFQESMSPCGKSWVVMMETQDGATPMGSRKTAHVVYSWPYTAIHRLLVAIVPGQSSLDRVGRKMCSVAGTELGTTAGQDSIIQPMFARKRYPSKPKPRLPMMSFGIFRSALPVQV